MPRIDEKALFRELLRREQHQTAVAKKRVAPTDAPLPVDQDYAFLKDLFDLQRAFILDPSDHKTLLCSRRAGKSYTAVAYLLKEALDNPGVTCVYIATTRIHAKRILEKELSNFNQRYRLGAIYNKTELVVTLPNGSSILLTGANDATDIERLRGGKYALVVVDECASYGPHFETLVEEIIEPALLDLDGTLCLLGTPGPAAAGFFYQATTTGTTTFGAAPTAADIAAGDDRGDSDGDGTGAILWRNFHWTVLDNVALRRTRDIPKWLANKRKRKGWTEDHPIYKREWLGEWTRSTDDLVYGNFDPLRNTYQALPDLQHRATWKYVLGIDFGYNDAFVVTALAFSSASPNVYEVETYKKSKLIPSQMAVIIEEFVQRYDPVSVVADAGALGKAIVEELKQRYGLPIKAAEKQNKVTYIDLLNGDLYSGRLLFRPEAPQIAEMQLLQWDANSKRTREDESYANDACFVAGTRIVTARGRIPIEQVVVGDKVRTRFGWYPVTAQACTGIKSLIRLTTMSGHTVTATGNHPLLTATGWKRLDTLTTDDIVYAWRDCDTSRAGTDTAPCGNAHTDQFHQGITSTTKTTTHAITRWITWNASRLQNMLKDIVLMKIGAPLRNAIFGTQLRRHQNGTGHQPVRRGIKCTLKQWLLRKNPWIAYALCVEEPFYQSAPQHKFVGGHVTHVNVENPDSTISTTDAYNVESCSSATSMPKTFSVAPTRVQRLEIISAAPVYNITVAEAHEYFAEGLLVSNCDSTLYAWRECKHWLPSDDVAPRTNMNSDPFDREAALRPRQPAEWWAKDDPAAADAKGDLLTDLNDGNFLEGPVTDDWLS